MRYLIRETLPPVCQPLGSRGADLGRALTADAGQSLGSGGLARRRRNGRRGRACVALHPRWVGPQSFARKVSFLEFLMRPRKN